MNKTCMIWLAVGLVIGAAGGYYYCQNKTA